MALLLTITDNADGTGGVATITGSDAATNTVYVLSPPNTSWISAGVRTGDGTVTLAIAPGYYFAYATGTVSALPAVSPVLNLFAITSGQTSVEEHLLNMVKAEVQGLCNSVGDPFPPASQVYGPGMKVNPQVMLPAFFVTTENVGETMLGYTTNRDDYGKPVVLAFMDRNDPDLIDANGVSVNQGKYLYVRQTVMRHFNGQRPPGVPEGYFCSIEPVKFFLFGGESENGGYQITISPMILRFKTREVRTP